MTTLTAVPLSRLQTEPLRWLWEPYLARGKLTVLDGDPGTGKSLVALDLAARLSRGHPLPDGSPGGSPLTVLWVNAEDGPDTTGPRAEAAGADPDRIVCVAESAGPPRLPDRLPELEEVVRQHDAGLVILDPLMAFLPPEVASGSDQCIRTVLTPLAGLADRTGAAVVLVRHLNKTGRPRAIFRGLGSIGIAAAARTVLLIARRPDDPEARVLAVAKTNLNRGAGPVGFRIAADPLGRPVVNWDGPTHAHVDSLCRGPEAPLRARERASLWLLKELANGPLKVAEILARAAEAGIPERTLKRAKVDIGIASERTGDFGDGEWFWYDPHAPWPKDCPFPRPFRP